MTPADTRDVCEQARDLAAECSGEEPPPLPAEGCVGTYAEAAELALERGCPGDHEFKYDENSFFCRPDTLWMGLCKPQPLADAAAVPGLDDQYCLGRSDALCEALRGNRFEEARDHVRAEVASDPGGALFDGAVQYYVRERALALFAWRVLGKSGFFDGYFRAVDELLAEHFPAYPKGSIAMARFFVPPLPAATCSEPAEALLIFPGVVRLVTRDEFAEFIAAAKRELPCLEVIRVDTGSFVEPGVNAARAKRQVDELDARLGRRVPLHMLGYSQGAANALRTLTDHPDIAARTRTVVTMNGAAHGSEVADLAASALGDLGKTSCATWPIVTRPICEWAAVQTVAPSDAIVRLLATAMGIPADDFKRFFAAEDDIAASPTLRDFLINHRPGIDSLTTAVAAQFWSERGHLLPRTALYVSLRSVISDRRRNLPSSNAMFASLLDRSDGFRPWNDMQVRLPNQSQGGPIAGVEVVGRVAEGNHWQWELADGAVPASIMDPDMTRRTPDVDLLLAHYQALRDAGLLH